MRIIACEPDSWFLFENEGSLLFNVNCNYGPVGYDFTIELTIEEKKEFKIKGKHFLQSLANLIDYSTPISRDSASPYKGRSVDERYSALMAELIREWQSELKNT
jgi:hypothetical protein